MFFKFPLVGCVFESQALLYRPQIVQVQNTGEKCPVAKLVEMKPLWWFFPGWGRELEPYTEHTMEMGAPGDQSPGCGGTDHLAGSCPIAGSVISELKTVLPFPPNSPVPVVLPFLSLPAVSCLTLGQLGRCTCGTGPISDPIPKLVFRDHYFDEFHR